MLYNWPVPTPILATKLYIPQPGRRLSRAPADRAVERGLAQQINPHLCTGRIWENHICQRMGCCLRATRTKDSLCLAVFDAGQLQALVLYFLNLHHAGYLIAQIFFGLWLLPLGILVYQSSSMAKIVGILLMVACFGYLVDVFTFLLIPGFDVVFSQFTFVGEVVLLLWLLIKGVNVEQWEKRTLQSALAVLPVSSPTF